jgi:hypothetical protein
LKTLDSLFKGKMKNHFPTFYEIIRFEASTFSRQRLENVSGKPIALLDPELHNRGELKGRKENQ